MVALRNKDRIIRRPKILVFKVLIPANKKAAVQIVISFTTQLSFYIS